MSRIITYRSLLFLALGISYLSLSGNLKEAENPRGWAKVEFGKVGKEGQVIQISGNRNIAGIYPHLTTYSQSRKDGRFFKPGHEECGIGAVVPWADKLWMITYAPHKPKGSDHKLYSIDQNLTMTVHHESVGGTPAGRMIHHESCLLYTSPSPRD